MKLKQPESHRQSLIKSFNLIRLEDHTFRAIYRLTILGAVEDFTLDYSGKTITAELKPLSEGKYRENLKQYIQRYAPMEVPHYLDIADNNEQQSELKRCIHALIQFVYGRIAKQRIAAMDSMETETKRGISDANAFSDAIVTFFDSAYISELLPYINNYDPELVFKICKDTAGASAKLSHLVGACNRLIIEHPDHPSFLALRAFAYALSGYPEENIFSDLNESLKSYERYLEWGMKEKLDFLSRLRSEVAFDSFEAARVLDAVILDFHIDWLHTWNKTSGELIEQTNII